MKYISICLILTLVSCMQKTPETVGVEGAPDLFPDYVNVTIPVNIAPLNFRINSTAPAFALFSYKNNTLRVKAKKGTFDIPRKAWLRLLQQAADDSIRVTLYERKPQGWMSYTPFSLYVKADPVDSYLVYRRLAPGYRMWTEMGIYQRNLENFTEETILTNKLTHNNCMNCHTFCNQSPEKMLFHQRSKYAGTYLVENGEVEKLQVDNAADFSSLVYPYWHPSGQFIAFSSNNIKQDFHLTDRNRIEVFDLSSDIVVYDMKKKTLFTTPLLHSSDHLETFPTFSPDGRSLVFCAAPLKPMPESFQEMKYHLLSIAFDAASNQFGQTIDTLYNAEKEGRSAKFPRFSPDGNHLLFTVSDYGNFSIWHKDADLRLINLQTNVTDSLPHVNSTEADSYHSWSSNSRWFVFSSRRTDGLYTRPYICYIDETGKTGKPFLLPQKNTNYYDNSLYSFNLPEFVKGKVNVSTYKLTQFTVQQ